MLLLALFLVIIVDDVDVIVCIAVRVVGLVVDVGVFC